MSNGSVSTDTNSDPAIGLPQHRYNAELANEIELRWQAHWDDNETFAAPNPAGPLADAEAIASREEQLFILDMFPYPSGRGLHVGHPLGFIATDCYARFNRMLGRNVLYTMGFDAFGLPAEQYAVQTGQHPAITTDENISNMRRQLHRTGLSHDQRRSISTTDPDYYRWTQWIFKTIYNSWYDEEAQKARHIDELIEQFENGQRPLPKESPAATFNELSKKQKADLIDSYRLAYIAHAPVNWCPGLGTVVANEEVTADGRSDRGNFPVFKRDMRQWMMRISKYGDRLIDDLDLLDWPEPVKTMQRNWVGRSEGASVDFSSPAGKITVFTTRPDTLFGASFMVLAPEHPLVDALTTPECAQAVKDYKAAAAAKNDIDRSDATKEKTGVATGSYATNPMNGKQIPVWIADYVMMGYGTGAIMAVPCGDERDFEFARTFGLEIPAIQSPPSTFFEEHEIDSTATDFDPCDTTLWPTPYVGDAPFVNSANETLSLNGIASVAEAKTVTIDWLEQNDLGERTISYKLRDWLFSRQRYWGEPFPIVYDQDGIAHVLGDEHLPVTLPETDSFAPRTFDADDASSDPESPLDRLEDWVKITLDLGDGPKTYRRDTNVMPQWAGSCWYEMRYLDPTNQDAFCDPEVERYWMGPKPHVKADHPGGVDLYVGGVEHAVLHLLYARFWHKVLFDLGHVSSKEPFYRLFNQGYILAYAYKDQRGIYVEAADVEKASDGTYNLDGEQVEREWGKMGKSLKNAVSPDEMYESYGADTLRLYEMAMGPLDASRPWETRDVVGMFRFLQRLWRNIVDENTGELLTVDEAPDKDTLRLLHVTIDAVNTELSNLRFNTAIAKMVELNNYLTKLKATPKTVAEQLVLMLAPIAPHISEELWLKLGHNASLAFEPFPQADPALLVADSVEYPVQVNGKVRGRISMPVDASNDEIEKAALAEPNVVRTVDGKPTKKVIVIPGRMVNIVI